MSQKIVKNRRFGAVNLLGMAMFVVAGVSQARVQVFQRNDIVDKATKSNRFIIKTVDRAHRGGIFDRDGRPLAQDSDTRVLTVRFDKVPNSPGFFMDLAAATGIPASDFAQFASQDDPKAVQWSEDITSAQAAAVGKVKSRWRADGVGLAPSAGRTYSLNEMGAGVIGYVRNGIPMTGLELSKSGILGGIDGKIVGIRDREGEVLPMRLDRETVQRKDGAPITLTLDSDLQKSAAEAVKIAVQSNKATQGAAIVIGPSGDILAMANYPTLDPQKGIEHAKSNTVSPDFNAAYMSALEPGSTFKVLTLAEAMNLGVVDPRDVFNCTGSLTISGKTMHCAHNEVHGAVTPETAIAESCNMAAAHWAGLIGRDNFISYIKSLGLLDKPGLGLPREGAGIYQMNDYTKNLQLANNGFGQSMNFTPLTLCAAFAMLANDGVRVYPRLIKKVGEQEIPNQVGSEIVRPEIAHEVLEMMRSVLEDKHGTGKSLRIPGYAIGGKTGTAQKQNVRVGPDGKHKYVANFVGFVPAQQPKATILVMIDDPSGGKIYGADGAGPAFKSIAQAVIRRYHIPPTSSVQAENNVLPLRERTNLAQSTTKLALGTGVAAGKAGASVENRTSATAAPQIMIHARPLPSFNEETSTTDAGSRPKVRRAETTHSTDVTSPVAPQPSVLTVRNVAPKKNRRVEPKPQPMEPTVAPTKKHRKVEAVTVTEPARKRNADLVIKNEHPRRTMTIGPTLPQSAPKRKSRRTVAIGPELPIQGPARPKSAHSKLKIVQGPPAPTKQGPKMHRERVNRTR